MIIHRAFYREAAQTTLAIIVILLIVLLFFGMTALLARAIRGDFASDVVAALLGWQTLKRLDLLLPLGVYLGILLTLSRWYRDSEMTALAACGFGVPQILRPVMVLTLGAAAIAAASAFYLTPLATQRIEIVKAASAQRPELLGLAPGTFTESGAGGRIVYAETVASDGRLENIFVARGRASVILARSGYLQADPVRGERRVVLERGYAYDGVPGAADYRMIAFERYTVRLETKPFAVPRTPIEGLPTRELLGTDDRDHVAEWHWRLSKPITLIVLALFAVALAYTDTRRGRLASLFGAILIYFIYSNLLGIGETLISKGQIPAGTGLWWVHGGFVLLGVYLLVRRAAHRPLLRVPWS